MDREEALDTVLGQIERQFGKGAVMKMNDQAQVVDRRHLHRVALARRRPRRRRAAARPRRRGVRPGVVGQDDARLPRDRRGPAPRRHLRVHRRRARDGSRLREAHRRQHRRAARLAARHGRAGARDLRAARPLGRARRGRDRLGRGAHAEGRDRGRDGRLARRPAGPADVQALRKLAGTLNRTDTICLFTNQLREKIGVMFGNPETTTGRPRAPLLRLGAARHPPHRDAQGRRRGDRQPRPGEGGQEQGRAAVQAGGVRHHLRRRHLVGGHGPRHRARAEGRPEVGLVLLVRRRASRSGTPERDRLPQGAPGRRPGDPARDPGAGAPTGR